jgi:hypothetical protein
MCMEGNSNFHQNSKGIVDTLVMDLSILPMRTEPGKNQPRKAIQRIMSVNLKRIPANLSQNKGNVDCHFDSIPKRRYARSLSPTLSNSISDIKYEKGNSQSDCCLCQLKKGLECEWHSNENKLSISPSIRVETQRKSSIRALVTNFDKGLPITTRIGKESRTSSRRKTMDLSNS